MPAGSFQIASFRAVLDCGLFSAEQRYSRHANAVFVFFSVFFFRFCVRLVRELFDFVDEHDSAFAQSRASVSLARFEGVLAFYERVRLRLRVARPLGERVRVRGENVEQECGGGYGEERCEQEIQRKQRFAPRV